MKVKIMIRHFKLVAKATIKTISVIFVIMLSSTFTYFMMKTLSEILNNKYLISNALAITPILYVLFIVMLAEYIGGKNEIKKN
ncbi:hypothetical protein BTR19_19550 [Pseudomonas fluorescens]|nr:hypothetical protein BTR19_19550 [Pseudomonas fluorescens]